VETFSIKTFNYQAYQYTLASVSNGDEVNCPHIHTNISHKGTL